MEPEISLEGAPHPRERHAFLGQEAAAAAFAAQIRSGRLPHAWLIGGVRGVGKATLAYRVARRLLAAPDERVAGADGLAVDPGSRTARQVAAGSHPNVMVLERADGEASKAAARTVPIEAVRRALAFFGQTSADGGYRICIVDPIEDLTLAGANALLKTVEEPPDRALILVVSHSPQRVLPTIRSRCRKLTLERLSRPALEAVLRSLGPLSSRVDDEVLRDAVGAAEGSVHRALTLLDPKRLAIVRETGELLARLPDVPVGRVLALGERLADRRADGDMSLALDAVLRWAGERIEADQELGPGRLAPLAEACETILEASRSVETYNLDRRPFVVSMFEDLAEAVRRAA